MQPERPITSRVRIVFISLFASFLVLGVALIIQWLVYDDWLRQTGPLRIAGTTIAALITFGFVLRWQYAVREQQREMIRRFELISHMNDRIRNALQAIECMTYVAHPEATEAVKREVNAIDSVLRDVLSDAESTTAERSRKNPMRASRKSA
ncbi:MAG TPA: hypothetical protein VIB39_15960 [Candidatus Angelobacter sp.]|jgi:hypothetical protein